MEVSKINGYDIKDKQARDEIEFIKISKANDEDLDREIEERVNSYNTLDLKITSKANDEDLDREIEERVNSYNTLTSKINSLSSGSPIPVDSIEDMTDTSKIYVNTTDGNWYYYNGTNWVVGGVYQSTGIGINEIQTKNFSFNTQKACNSRVPEYEEILGAYRQASSIISNASFTYTSPIELKKGETIEFLAKGYLTNISIIIQVDDTNNYISLIQNSIDSDLRYYGYTATKDMYVSLCYLNNTIDDLVIYKSIDSAIEEIQSVDLGEITKNTYINHLGNVVEHNYGAYSTTDYIKVIPLSSYKLKDVLWTSTDNIGMAFYDINKNFVSYVKNPQSNDIEYIVPKDCYYVRHTLRTQKLDSTKLLIVNLINTLNELSLPKNTTEFNCAFFNAFNKFGVIGDSLSSGECVAVKNGIGQYIDNYDYSWGQYIAKKYGMNCINFSSGGLTTRSWLSSYLSALQDSNKKCNAYIIALGVNDCNTLGSEYLGSVTDINTTDYNQNADTFYGNYGKIISHIKLVQPKAKIFMFTIPAQIENDTRYNSYNNAIREISSLYDNVYLIDIANYEEIFTTGFIANNMRGGHYNAIAYNYMADLIYNWLSGYMSSNYTEFTQIEFIGTNYEY